MVHNMATNQRDAHSSVDRHLVIYSSDLYPTHLASGLFWAANKKISTNIMTMYLYLQNTACKYRTDQVILLHTEKERYRSERKSQHKSHCLCSFCSCDLSHMLLSAHSRWATQRKHGAKRMARLSAS